MKKMKKEDEMNVPLSAVLAPLSDSWRRRYERLGTSSTILGDHRSARSKNDYPFFDIRKEQNICTINNSEMTRKEKIFQPELSDLNPWAKTFTTKTKEQSSSSDDKLVNKSCNASNDDKTSDKWCVSKSLGCNDLEGYENDKSLMKSWKSILRIGQHINSQFLQSKSPSKICSCDVKLQDLLIILARAHSLPKPEEIFGKRDSISKQISHCLNAILDNVEFARGVIAHISDAMHEKDEEGVDIKNLCKIIDAKSTKCLLRIEEIEIVRQMLKEANEWESKLSTPIISENEDIVDISCSEELHLPRQSLANAEELALCGRSLSLRPQSLSVLDERIQRAYELRNRIREWTNNKVRTSNILYEGCWQNQVISNDCILTSFL